MSTKKFRFVFETVQFCNILPWFTYGSVYPMHDSFPIDFFEVSWRFIVPTKHFRYWSLRHLAMGGYLTKLIKFTHGSQIIYCTNWQNALFSGSQQCRKVATREDEGSSPRNYFEKRWTYLNTFSIRLIVHTPIDIWTVISYGVFCNINIFIQYFRASHFMSISILPNLISCIWKH